MYGTKYIEILYLLTYPEKFGIQIRRLKQYIMVILDEGIIHI